MPQLPRLVLLGLPIRTSWTWMAVALCMTLISFYQLAPEDEGTAVWVLGAAIVAAGTLGSIVLHDAGHVLAARRVGSDLISLEPSLIGALPDTNYAADTPREEVRIALAGPAVNVPVALLLAAIWWLAGMPRDLPGSSILILAAVNAGLLIVGMLPGYPFDGGRVFRAFLWHLTGDLVRATRLASIYGHVLLFMGLLGGLVLLSIGNEAAVWGTWLLILCWTINRARSHGFSQILWAEAGRNLQIDDLFQAGVNRVPADASIDECIESLLDNFRRGPTLVIDQQDVVGIVELSSARRVPRADWFTTPVSAVMTPTDGLICMASDTSVSDLLAALPAGASNIVLVEKYGKIVAAANREFVIDRVESYTRAQRFNRRRGSFPR